MSLPNVPFARALNVETTSSQLRRARPDRMVSSVRAVSRVVISPYALGVPRPDLFALSCLECPRCPLDVPVGMSPDAASRQPSAIGLDNARFRKLKFLR